MKDFDIKFKWIGASTWILSIDNLKIGSDPVLCQKDTLQHYRFFKTKRRTEPNYESKDFENIDFWLLTHEHEDHIDAYGVTKIEPESKVYANSNLKKWLKLIYATNVDYLKWGEKKIFEKENLKVTIEAIPCVHASNYIAAKLAGSVNGYWLTVEKNKSKIQIYVTGDTVNHQKVKTFLKGRNADIMIPNIGAGGLDKFGGPYTFTANQFMDFEKTVNPKIILPVHHKTFSLYKESIEKLYAYNDNRVLKFDEGDTLEVK
jgi:L-ascorbate metabolism protein UlaG (beta-lactamase superfamily)